METIHIAPNVCLNKLRSQKKTPDSARDYLLMHIACFDDYERRFLLGHFLERLFRRKESYSREIAVMHFLYGMTLEDVAAETGFSISGVRKCIRQWKQFCQDHCDEEVFHVN